MEFFNNHSPQIQIQILHSFIYLIDNHIYIFISVFSPILYINMSNTPNKSTPEPESTVFHGSIFEHPHLHHSVSERVNITTPRIKESQNHNHQQQQQASNSLNFSDQVSGYDYPSATIEEQIDLRLASSNNPTIVMELDLDGNIRYLSKNWEYIVGTNIKKIVNRHISKIIIGNNDDDSQVFNIAI